MSGKLAMQLFTLRDYTKTAKDFADTIKKISDIGYKAAQISAVGAMNGDNPELSAVEAKKILDDNGVKCIATHRSWDDLVNKTDAEIEFHKQLDCDFAAIGMIPYPHKAENYTKFIDESAPVIEKLNAAGIKFGYHNHWQEFTRESRGGKWLLEYFMEQENIMMELDLYWVEHAGLNCVPIVKRCAGRIPVIHLKDKEASIEENSPVIAPIGEGNMDWDSIIPACEESGVEWYAIEQDQCYRDAFDCVRSSYEFLTSKGL